MAVQLTSILNAELEIELPSHVILQSSTIKHIIEHVEQTKGSTAFQSLVLLKAGDHDLTPLFLIHPVGGTVFIYRDLVNALKTPVPVYGIQAKIVESQTFLENSIEEMAAKYLELIQSIQPSGPYQLAGLSFGGMVAYEIANQCAEKGENVSFLGLLDTPGVTSLPKMLLDDAEVISYLLQQIFQKKISIDYLRGLTDEARMQCMIQHMSHPAFQDLMTVEKMRSFLAIFKSNMKAMVSYQPTNYQQKNNLIFIRADVRDELLPHHPETDWQALAGEKFTLYEVAGGHTTMLFPPHVLTIAHIFDNHFIKEALTV